MYMLQLPRKGKTNTCALSDAGIGKITESVLQLPKIEKPARALRHWSGTRSWACASLSGLPKTRFRLWTYYCHQDATPQAEAGERTHTRRETYKGRTRGKTLNDDSGGAEEETDDQTSPDQRYV